MSDVVTIMVVVLAAIVVIGLVVGSAKAVRAKDRVHDEAPGRLRDNYPPGGSGGLGL